MAKFDLIAFDLDGTVFPEPSAKSIRPRVVAALQAAHDAGVITAVAFGDSGNDATFADSACTFVAMGNATPEIKAVADDICPSVKQDGVAVWLEDHLGLV